MKLRQWLPDGVLIDAVVPVNFSVLVDVAVLVVDGSDVVHG